jgi:hypothetical protein
MKKMLSFQISGTLATVALLLLMTVAGCKKANVAPTSANGELAPEELMRTAPPAALIIGRNNSSSGSWTAKLTSLVSNGSGGFIFKTVGYVGTFHYPNEVPFWSVPMGCASVTIPGIDTQNWAGLRINTIYGNYSACPNVTFRNKVFSPVNIPANSSQTLFF